MSPTANNPLPVPTGGAAANELAALLSPGTVLLRDELLAHRTTMRVGGPADIYVEPTSQEDLARILGHCATARRPWFVLGRGSNLLVKDGGFRGVVICLAHPSFSRIEVTGERLRCGTGARLKQITHEAKRHSIAGLEFLEGIPGTLGGALRMNAGAMGGAMFEIVESVRIMTSAGEIQESPGAQMGAQYRECTTLKDCIALEAVLKGQPGIESEIEQRMKALSQKRWQSQPAAASAGCMFKNPASVPAGKLIDHLGLKGTRVGGASVSVEHGNFLVNDGTATARDILDLIQLIQSRVLAERGIQLETEVEIIGE